MATCPITASPSRSVSPEPLQLFYPVDPIVNPSIVGSGKGPYHPSFGDICTNYPLVIPSNFPHFAEVSNLLTKYANLVKEPKAALSEEKEASEEYLEWQRTSPMKIQFELYDQFLITGQAYLDTSVPELKDVKCKENHGYKLYSLDKGEVAAFPNEESRNKYLRMLALWCLLRRGVRLVDTLRDQWEKRGRDLGLEYKDPCEDEAYSKLVKKLDREMQQEERKRKVKAKFEIVTSFLARSVATISEIDLSFSSEDSEEDGELDGDVPIPGLDKKRAKVLGAELQEGRRSLM